jgi:hypothetical protein
MCGLCGILGDGTHWTDGIPGAGDHRESAVPWLRRQERRHRISVGNLVLRHYGLSLSEWQGASFLLRTRTGATDVTLSLGDLWPKAEQLARRPLDPLDPELLKSLGGG